jgi:dolichyl-phosphate beta-glucosyltransferase
VAVDACRWSVVIPALDEAPRLPDHLGTVLAYFDARREPYEVLVVDASGQDATLPRVRQAAAGHPAVRVLVLAGLRGKGAAVSEGMQRSRGALRLMTDADGATPIDQVARLESAITGGADVAVGARARPATAGPGQRRREAVARVFNLVARAVGVRGVTDTQSGFKLFKGIVAADLFADVMTAGYGFDVEMLLLAQRRGYRVVEVGVEWTDQPGSRVGVARQGPRMLTDVLRARWRLGRVRASGRAG